MPLLRSVRSLLSSIGAEMTLRYWMDLGEREQPTACQVAQNSACRPKRMQFLLTADSVVDTPAWRPELDSADRRSIRTNVASSRAAWRLPVREGPPRATYAGRNGRTRRFSGLPPVGRRPSAAGASLDTWEQQAAVKRSPGCSSLRAPEPSPLEHDAKKLARVWMTSCSISLKTIMSMSSDRFDLKT